MKKALTALIVCALILSLLSACGTGGDEIKHNTLSEPTLTELSADASENVLRAAVLYDGEGSSQSWRDVYSRLCQPMLLNFTVDALDVSGEYDLSEYDVIYPDEGIMSSGKADRLRKDIASFAENGGGVFLTNGFYSFFDEDFLGADSFYEVEDYPYYMQYPEVCGDLRELQDITRDFYTLYEAYADFPELEALPRGVGMKPSTAVTVAERGGLSLCTVNEYGKGYVFLCSGLLPNPYCISNTELDARSERQRYFADTSVSCARLLENAFAAFCQKRTQGYAAWRVFGSFGSPVMSWELHYEAMTGFADGSAIRFAELCEEYDQIPSYTLVRNTYTWFLRAESVTTLLGNGSLASGFAMDMDESAYSSGTHVAAGNVWLSIGEIEDGGSYFTDYPELDLRAYPYAADLDGDGDTDLVCGAADGLLRLYDGLGYTDRLKVAEAVVLTDAFGKELSVPGYSAPVLADINGDGFEDILCGASDGNLYLFAGGEPGYTSGSVYLRTGLTGQCFPDAGDLNGDGVIDIAVGSNEGKLLAAYGLSGGGFGDFFEIPVFGVSGDWLAPRIIDIDGDGVSDLAVGTADGYIALLASDGSGQYASGGFISLDEMNYKGNYNAKFGSNCCPFFADINGDGKLDLVCGSLEYGMAYPIDSEYFPYKTELAESLNYFKDKGYYVGAHFYTNAYASPEREEYELTRHLEAMKTYGAGYGTMGANQHTWYTSSLDYSQSLRSLWSAGFLWQSGYAPSREPYPYPQSSAKNVVSLPFYLTQDGEKTLLVQNCSTLLYSDESWTDISAKYGMPVLVYYHCDFTTGHEDTARENIEKVEAFREKHGYGFVMEDQLMLGTAAALNLTLSVSGGSDGFSLTLTPGAESLSLPLYSGNYQSSCGVRISLGDALADKSIVTDSPVWRRDGNELYVGLTGAVRVYEAEAEATGAHISRVNLPAAVSLIDSGAIVSFSEGGLMELAVAGEAKTSTEGWETESRDGETVFTKTGSASSITVTFGG